MAFTAVFRFGTCSALPDMGAKMPPAGRRTAHKRREAAGEYRDKGGHVGGPGGHKKPAPGCPRAGNGGIQDFFAVSQMIIKGRSKTNRIIKRCTSSQALRGDPVPRCTLLRMRSRHGFRKRGGIAGGQRSTGAAPVLRLLSWLARSWLIPSILPAGGSSPRRVDCVAVRQRKVADAGFHTLQICKVVLPCVFRADAVNPLDV